ncbi:MFS transporter [uncultured Sphingomonas sp.]|uniref:MFS transporter n=1 Tax=uncultured Sphingomonas sp. TaxID=158754 RepID=UPI0035C9894C
MTEPSAIAVPPVRRLATGTMLAYAVGAIAYGVKDNGFGTFLLLFYNQVLGLPSAAVGLVVMAALVVDAMVDPAIGFLSDRTRSRWGRRHPWMYAAPVPIAIGWILLWNPPALSEPVMLAWLFVTAVIVRSAVSAYEVPSVALTAELTSDYDERTRIMAYRYLFGWAGGLAMLMAAYTIFLPSDAAHPLGLLDRRGYAAMAWAAAAAIVVAILVSAIGTHREIARLPPATPSSQTLSANLRELRETVRNRGFAVLMLAGLCLYTDQGISFALSTYLYGHVWRFSGTAYSWLALALLAGAAMAFAVAPRLGARFGKPVSAMVLMLAAVFLLVLPYALRLFGLFPAPHDAAMLPVLMTIFAINTACNVASMILGASMMADVVEESEQRTGRRSEGVFFAGAFFIQKCTTGVGIFTASMILTAARFPAGRAPGQVAPATVDRMTIVFCAVYAVLGVVGAILYARFPFGKREHEARVAAVATESNALANG